MLFALYIILTLTAQIHILAAAALNLCCAAKRSYAAFKVAGSLIPSSPKRAAFMRAIGSDTYKLIVAQLQQEGAKASPVQYNAAAAGAELGTALTGVQILLSYFKTAGFISDYKLDFGEFEPVSNIHLVLR
jgi:hypothetical protein